MNMISQLSEYFTHYYLVFREYLLTIDQYCKKIINILILILSIGGFVLSIYLYESYMILIETRNKQNEDIAFLKETHEQLIEENRWINYKNRLLVHDEALFYEMVIRDKLYDAFEDEKIYRLK